jgi:hypothetical protein
MVQNEVFDYLRTQRLKGNHNFFSMREIYDGLLDMKTADLCSRRRVWEGIRMLKKFNYIEVEGVGEWPSYMRLREKYVKDY